MLIETSIGSHLLSFDKTNSSPVPFLEYRSSNGFREGLACCQGVVRATESAAQRVTSSSVSSRREIRMATANTHPPKPLLH